MKYKVGDKVVESNYNRGIIKEIEYRCTPALPTT